MSYEPSWDFITLTIAYIICITILLISIIITLSITKYVLKIYNKNNKICQNWHFKTKLGLLQLILNNIIIITVYIIILYDRIKTK